MSPEFDAFMGFNILVEVRQNDRGAWSAEIELSKDGLPVVHACPRTIQPEWLTAEEATREGIEWARPSLIHQCTGPSHSTVATRQRTFVRAHSEIDRRPHGTTFHDGF
ncbi:DUF6566 family protein [Paraburkholderia caledonica]|uniref:DUF6566 family protein n=1 Tax=Paraburkholderia caledonica TaxID=134536 RepID=UPI0013DFB801|nr:DUF6566 family protein [Paraburkholderia caledonica]